MAVRSARLWTMDGLNLDGFWVTVATVPPDERWILKEIAVRHAGTAAALVFMRSSSDAHFFAHELLPGSMTVFDRWAILPEGSQVQVRGTGIIELRGIASGTRLAL